ncbi:MAG TPA: Gfo/Idh/MocA family oxidoreductase [Afifellaceae bacterium]|nr:Gfo/Idh/MocA family oxidoreductase [Afifellaceae bacterium]
MNLHKLAAERGKNNPIRVGVIGAGKFASMFLTQAPTMAGLRVTAIADLNPDGARARLKHVGWDEARIAATDLGEDGAMMAGRDDVDVVIEATGDPVAGVRHALAAVDAGKHVIMVNVEADVLAGPAMAKRARSAGVVYSMAYGDQPALIAEMVDWARATGFSVAAAGQGTKYLPEYHTATPETVWDHFGLTAEEARAAGMNSQMFNSFLDGTKSAIEMAAVANGCGLNVPGAGLAFPPSSVDDLAAILCPQSAGGQLAGDGYVEVVSSLHRDGSEVEKDLRWGVYVILKAPTDYAADCFRQYGLRTDASGRYAAMYKPFHLIGLELGISVYSAALRGEATGSSQRFRGDAVAVAKRDLAAGETLDGEGGFTVWGRLMPAADSIARSALPIGLAKDVTLSRDVAAGTVLSTVDVTLDETTEAFAMRQETLTLTG